MPFGIPPSDPRPAAAQDYCDATTSDMVDLINEVVQPIVDQVQWAEQAIAQITARIKAWYGRQEAGYDREFDEIYQALNDYSSTLSTYYNNQVETQTTIYNAISNYAPPGVEDVNDTITGPVSINITGPVSVTGGGVSGGSSTVTQSGPVVTVPAPVVNVTVPVNVTEGEVKVTEGAVNVPVTVSEAAPQVTVTPDLIPAPQVVVSNIFPPIVPPAPVPVGQPTIIYDVTSGNNDRWVAIDNSGRVIYRGPTQLGVEQWLGINVPGYVPPPPPPRPGGRVTCPKAPSNLAGLSAPWGSAEWCGAAEHLLDWLETSAAEMFTWLNDRADLTAWAIAIKQWQPPDSWYQWAKDVAIAVRDLLVIAVKISDNAIKMAIDGIRCMWYYNRVMAPMKRPAAYSGLVLLRSVLKSIDDTRFGSQSYLGFTLGAHVSLPALERMIDALSTYMLPLEVPGMGEVTEAWLGGYVTDTAQVECLMRLNGANPSLFWPFLKAKTEKLGAGEMIQYVRRQGGNKDDERNALRALGFVDDRYAAAFQELYWELPSIGDHLEWLRKNVFDTEYVKDFDLLNGFDERFWPKFGKDLTSLGMKKEYAELHYAAHWLNPSFTQLFEMTQRLRPGRVPKELEFTTADLLRVMQEQDVGVYFRKRLESVSHPVINLTLQMKLFGLGQISAEDFPERLRDLGYSEADATLIRDGLRFEVARLRASSGHGWSPTALAAALVTGKVDEQFVRDKMKLLGYRPDEVTDMIARSKVDVTVRSLTRVLASATTRAIGHVREALQVGVMSVDDATAALTALGIDAGKARGMAEADLVAERVRLVKAAVAKIKRAMIAGEIDIDYAEFLLRELGIAPAALAQYGRMWRIEQTPGRKRRTAQQIVKDLAHGDVDEDSAVVRWRNLGYSEDDIRLYKLDAKRVKGSVYAQEKEGPPAGPGAIPPIVAVPG